jgi:DNA polymerase IV
MGADFVRHLPVDRFHGIGPVTAARMRALGINTGADLRGCSQAFLVNRFGKPGAFYHAIARAEDTRPVEAGRIRKSVGAEKTFEQDLIRRDEAAALLAPLCDRVWSACGRNGVSGRAVTLKMKFNNFRQITRTHTLGDPVGSCRALQEQAERLLDMSFPLPRPVRLLGLSLSNLCGQTRSASQLALPLGSDSR